MKRFSILIITAFLAGGCGQKEDPETDPVRNVRAMKIGDFEGMMGRTFPGRARAAQEVDLAFRVSGPLTALPVKVGDEVEKGDTIARIDPRDFEVALRNAEGGLSRAKATANRAQLDYDRMAAAQKQNPGAVSERSVDQAREAVEVATADIAVFEASVEAASDAVEYTHLKAPFSGTIVATYVENFENVREKQMIVRLLDKSRIEFEVGIPETLISMAPYVEEVFVTFDAFPDDPVAGEINEIGREASATTRTFPVTVVMDQPENVTILPGMAGRARGKLKPPEGETAMDIVIPVTAVFAPEADNQSFVWIIDEASGAVSRRQVELGDLISSGYVVEKGLEQGEMIATAGVHFLKEGQVVAPVIQ